MRRRTSRCCVFTGRPPQFDSMDFYPLERARSSELPHDRVVVSGFPFDLTLVYRPIRQSAIFSRTLWGKMGTRTYLIDALKPVCTASHVSSG